MAPKVSHDPKARANAWFVFDADKFNAPTLAKGFSTQAAAYAWISSGGAKREAA